SSANIQLKNLRSAKQITSGVSRASGWVDSHPGVMQRVDFQFPQLRHNGIDKELERKHHSRMLQGTESKFTEKSVRARLGRDFPDLPRHGLRRAAYERALGDGMVDIHQFFFALVV